MSDHWKSIITALLLLSVRCLSAQNYQAELRRYGIEEGLSHREVEVIFQDRDGFLWLGTRFGLNRFDGYGFKAWTRAQYGFNFNDISRILQDDTGWLWLFNGDRELIFLHPHTGEIQSVNQRFGGTFPFKTTPDVWYYDPQTPAVDAAGRLHFITRHPDVEFTYHSREGFRQRAFVPAGLPEGAVLHGNFQKTFYNSVRSSTWQLRSDGWYIFGPDSVLQLRLLRADYPADLFNLNCVYADRQGHVWLGGDFGLTLVNVQAVHFQRYFSFSDPARKPFNNSARGIWADEDAIFVNFEMGGLVKIARHPSGPGASWQLLDRTTDAPGPLPPGLYGYWGRPLLHDPDGSFWIGADHSLRHLDAAGRLLGKFTVEPDPSKPAQATDFWSIYRDSTGRLWLGYAQGLAYKDPGDQSLHRFTGLPGSDEFPRICVLQITEDREKQLWLCTNRGLYALDKTRRTALRYSSRDTGRYQLPAADFHHLYQDERGIYWLATSGNGLLRWDRRSGQVRRITHADGLSNDNVYAIYEDDEQQLWLSSDYGIMQVDKASQQVRTYLPKDGVAQEEFNRIAHFQAADGTIFLGGLNGVTAFQPKDFYPADSVSVTAPLCITAFQQFDPLQQKLVDRTAQLWRDQIIMVQPGDRFFQLEFALLAYENVAKIRYAWKIDGLDTDWNYQQERSIRLSRLPFGHHILRIKAQIANGQWSDSELVLAIHVVRPFYLSNWFLTGTVLFLLIAGYGLYRWRLRQLHQRQELLKKAIDQATTQIQQDKALIEQQAVELRQLDALKSRFFANVSHELRTPLTLLLGPVSSMLDSGDLSVRHVELLQKTRDSGRALLKLVNDLLDLSKLEHGKLTVQATPQALYPWLHRLVAAYESYAQSLRISLRLEFRADPALQLALDRDKWETIFNNLLSNALKFTPPGGSCTVRLEESPLWMRLLVTDTGAGIHPDDLPHIFKRFYQAALRPNLAEKNTPASREATGGTGIGLALSQELAQLLGGHIRVESRLGQGSTFCFEFPKQEVCALPSTDGLSLPAEEGTTPLATRTADTVTHPAAPTLLVVEDHPSLRAYLEAILSPHYRVITAAHGRAALDILQEGVDCQLILSDIMMPVMDGFQLVNQLKSDLHYQHLPIILLTARADLQDKVRALRIGVDDYLLKPFEEAELLARIDNLLRHARRRTKEPVPSASTPLPALGADQRWLEQLEWTVRQYLADPQFTTEFIAEKMSLSRRQLQRRLQQLAGLSPHAYIQEIRLHEARQLLEKRACTSVREVATALGYANAEYFSRQFRARFGKLPSQYLD